MQQNRHKADLTNAETNVRYWGAQNGHRRRVGECPLSGCDIEHSLLERRNALAHRASGLADCRRNSLFPPENSLFLEIFSLLIRIGNCPKSHCVAADFCSEIVFRSDGIAHFPVKFPVSREFAWRRARSALRRQPGSWTLRDNDPNARRNARQWRAFAT